jgi:endonuclease YncB( thermonuclease family)
MNNTHLINCDTKTVPYFNFNGKKFVAKPCDIYDGDTFGVVFYYNNELIKYKCRCYGYDTPEIKPSLSNPNRDKEKELAIKAKNRFIELINKSENKLITIECLKFDKYGRILVNVYNNVDTESVNDIMIREGHGKSYLGGTKDTNW